MRQTGSQAPQNSRRESRRVPAGLAARLSSGQAMVELAIVLPILIVLILAGMDLGRAFSIQAALANAAREGARYCSLHPGDTSGTLARVQADLGTNVPALTNTVTCPVASGGDSVTVTLAAPFRPATPVLGSFVGTGITLRAAATMVVW